jgi:Tfp pilus assembly protein PilV
MKSLRNQAGFTLLEVLIMAPILMVTIVLLMSYLFSQYGQLTQQGALINLQVEAQNITFSMQDDIFFARSFESDKNTNLVDTYQPGGGWQSNTSPPTLIISDVALTNNRRDANRQAVYIDTLGCSPQSTLEQNDELHNNTIYFVSGTNLYKRILTAPASMSTCGISYQKQTCPAANANSSCPADRLLTDKLSNFNLTYYDTDNNVTTTPEQAERVKVDIQLHDKAFAEDIDASSSITIRKLNL